MDRVKPEVRSMIMSRIRSESSIERVPPDLSHLRLRRHPLGVTGRPDFGNKARRLALFIDGCFWHGCPRHYREPKTNVAFWRGKLARNRRRDRDVDARLAADGWTVIRRWECEL